MEVFNNTPHDFETPIAPQLFARDATPSPEMRSLVLDSRKEDLKSLIANAAMQVCGFSDRSKLGEEIPPKEASAIANMRRENGYLLVDRDRFNELDPEKALLVSVFFAKARDNRDLLVPIIVAHDHPEDFGRRIKALIEDHFVQQHGATPEELVKSSTLKAFEGIAKYRNWIFSALAIGALVGIGVAKAPDAISGFKDWRAARAAAVQEQMLSEGRDVLVTAEKNATAIQQELISRETLFTTTKPEQFEVMLELLIRGTHSDKARVLQVLKVIGADLECYRFPGRQPPHNKLEVSDYLTSMIKTEPDPALRHNAADVLYNINNSAAK